MEKKNFRHIAVNVTLSNIDSSPYQDFNKNN